MLMILGTFTFCVKPNPSKYHATLKKSSMFWQYWCMTQGLELAREVLYW
jgi:hypothetical protein